MALLVQKINAVAGRLADVPELPRYTPLIIFTGFTKCSVTDFFGAFEFMLNTEKFIQLDNDGDRHDESKCLERVNNLTLLASKFFHYLHISNHWNIPSNHRHGIAKVKGPCDNCNGEHYSPDFPHPRDEAKIKNAKEECAVFRGGGGQNGGVGSGCGGGRQGDHKKWINDNKDGDKNDFVNGVQKRGNAWMCYCRRRECGWNATHTSIFHAAWKHDHIKFALPDDHDYWKL